MLPHLIVRSVRLQPAAHGSRPLAGEGCDHGSPLPGPLIAMRPLPQPEALLAHIGVEPTVSFRPPQVSPKVSLHPGNLPEYAARSCLRMVLALACSTLFTLLYGSLAVHNRRAERVLIPLLDILQSVPVLGFLSIFAIFTSQAWNITFSFYQSLRTVPKELGEAATLCQLSRWQRFSRLELPSAAILRSKDLFRQQVLARVPVLSSIVHTLQQKADRSLRSDSFLDIWDDDFPISEAERQLATAVDGRLSLPS